jgi:hypothetical protein
MVTGIVNSRYFKVGSKEKGVSFETKPLFFAAIEQAAQKA